MESQVGKIRQEISFTSLVSIQRTTTYYYIKRLVVKEEYGKESMKSFASAHNENLSLANTQTRSNSKRIFLSAFSFQVKESRTGHLMYTYCNVCVLYVYATYDITVAVWQKSAWNKHFFFLSYMSH